MTFPMPEIGYGEVRLLTEQAWKNACWNRSGAKKAADPTRWNAACVETTAEFEAWINYARQEYPDYACEFMLSYEHHWMPRLPFNDGDRWVFDVPANSWIIVKPDGQLIVTRNMKEK